MKTAILLSGPFAVGFSEEKAAWQVAKLKQIFGLMSILRPGISMPMV